MADNYKITAYNASTDVATITFNLDPRTNFSAVVNGVMGISGVPKDTTANVSAYLRRYADAYIAGKQAEAARTAAISPEVAALLNVVTTF
jgi:hypothetical protein